MSQRSFEPFEDIAVHLRAFADDFEAHCFAESIAQIADHSGETRNALTEGTHARAKDLEIETMRKMGRATVEQIEFLDSFSQELLAVSYGGDQLSELTPGT